jgi:hypothetical protein
LLRQLYQLFENLNPPLRHEDLKVTLADRREEAVSLALQTQRCLINFLLRRGAAELQLAAKNDLLTGLGGPDA